jgi:hypothetical protein
MKNKIMKVSITALPFILFCVCALSQQSADYYLFKWVNEPNEKAFKILLPQKWITDGGIFRINPTAGGGAANALEAKVDFSMKSDAEGTAMMRWYPDMFYFDSRYSPAGQMGLFPSGSNYQGMTVIPLMPPDVFIQQIVLHYAHPGISNISVTERKNLPELANAVQNEDKLLAGMGFKYQAALITVNYVEGGKVFEEKFVSVVMNLGQAGAGMWKNRYTFSVRAPRGKLKDYEPVFAAMGKSLTINRQWLAGEIKGQLERTGIYNKTMAEINRISEEINQHRQQNNAVIQHDMYLNITGQEDYINPFTNEIETGTNQWNHRWSGSNDFVIYTDDPNFDPNRVSELNHFEFQRSPVKKR